MRLSWNRCVKLLHDAAHYDWTLSAGAINLFYYYIWFVKTAFSNVRNVYLYLILFGFTFMYSFYCDIALVQHFWLDLTWL